MRSRGGRAERGRHRALGTLNWSGRWGTGLDMGTGAAEYLRCSQNLCRLFNCAAPIPSCLQLVHQAFADLFGVHLENASFRIGALDRLTGRVTVTALGRPLISTLVPACRACNAVRRLP